MKEEAACLKKMKYMTYSSMGDIYCLFYELANKLLKPDGILAFVTSGVGTTRWLKYTIETLPVPYPEKGIFDRIEKLALEMNNESISDEKDKEILSNI